MSEPAEHVARSSDGIPRFVIAGRFAAHELVSLQQCLDLVSQELYGSLASVIAALLPEKGEDGRRTNFRGEFIELDELALDDPQWISAVAKAVGDAGLAGVVCRFEDFDPKPLIELTEGEWASGLRQNATASWLLAKWALPSLAKTHGCFVAFTSRAAREVLPGGGIFPVAKALESSIVRSMAAEGAPAGARVNLISASPGLSPEKFRAEVCDVVGYALGPRSKALSGTVLELDKHLGEQGNTRSIFGLGRSHTSSRQYDASGRLRVIGGSGQIGLATIRSLASLAERQGRSGLDVVFAGLEQQRLAIAERELQAEGINAHAIACDLGDPTAPAELVRTAVELFGGVDLVHSNAAYGITDTALEAPLEQWNKIVSINLSATWRLAKAAHPYLRQAGGSLITTSSIAALNANARAPLYSATKSALNALMVQLAHEWAGEGIRANIVSPGSIDTPMNQLSALPEAQRQEIVQTFPNQRMGRPEEIAEGVAFLASDGASYITGHNLVIDGGLAQALR